MKYLIANWKASITHSQMVDWISIYFKSFINEKLDEILLEKQIKIILCPPYPLIPVIQNECSNYRSVKAGAQHISPIERGAYTGEVTAEVLKQYVEYAIIGHSERRKHFQLSEEAIHTTLDLCRKNAITPVLCIRGNTDRMYDAPVIAYEPVNAIGTGHNAEVQDVLDVKKSLNISDSISFLYGGSVDPANMNPYLQSDGIDGFLVGTSSLNPQSFFEMTKIISAA